MNRETFVDILQRRSEKTTSEQFWMVMLAYGLNGLLIYKHIETISFVDSRVVIAFSLFVTVWATIYIVHRHGTYMEATREMSRLLSDIEDAPLSMRRTAGWGGHHVLGWGFYVTVIWMASIATLIRYSHG